MDGDLPERNPPPRIRLWPGLWAPLIILIFGALSTLALSERVTWEISALARQTYQAEHQALAAGIAAHVKGASGSDLPAGFSSALASELPDGMKVRIDTLARHTKQALIELGQLSSPLESLSRRTELSLPGRHWMITTTPDASLIRHPVQEARWLILTAGASLTTLAALLALAGCFRLHGARTRDQKQQAALHRNHQQITNLQVEKSALRQALNDSETRSRDLVSLCGALIAELDDSGRIGFVSPQVADLLGHAPSDLTNQPFEHLIAPEDVGRFRECLEGARQEGHPARIDLTLSAKNDTDTVSACLRLKTMKDPIHGITGFRLSATPTLSLT
ncbi:PAS domain-containing protein [Marinobacter daepoensis]|uniref:PAS domain-containing protein n=1 Tax=Marinobacter daepoensis TaxID=262077 RepID=A0ABS3BAP3_9GAMM|nr:PAS domain S-box protein [Marinobacter daepoensis]MBN7768385.1 PAS domain-containing protein [Marinobacter daepoensis]MBY6080686.1 PAS domain-containing protein [Marinobacter daepoensis]